ncbi:hypothetical protein R7D66_06410 [Vibrio sp. Vb2354]|uniref:toxin-antitoxin system YwqK family antitoxin n=1 Tax=unclassified Vibrio TaxID=2614977 RepID=UPI0029657543|nr:MULTISPECIES: hypothetical protein [unclassified Vibrio]MDW1738127.1 hypothetical protein [Vibrio sp. Vb2321]MDW1757216.1 hypothetical protein [Vibrio sp. Vb2353]MDW1771508.1 hypothetical protein [Vibrio sp. Vb2354]MDW1807848.1 hypothetical protein [Vibrio sp. Vb2362]
MLLLGSPYKKALSLSMTIARMSQCLLFSLSVSATPFNDLEFERNIRNRNDVTALLKVDKSPYTGVAESFYDNGTKRAEAYYLNGKQHGPSFSWFEDGRLESKSHWLNGKKHGTEQEWKIDRSVKNDQGQPSYYLEELNTYQYGIYNGKQKFWREGRLYREVQYVNNKYQGDKKQWDIDKQGNRYLSSDEQYVDGTRAGLSRSYFADHRLKGEEYFNRGREDGMVLDYDIDMIDGVARYNERSFYFREDGKYEGIKWEHYKGKIRSIYSTRDGQNYGFIQSYNPQGILLSMRPTLTGKWLRYHRNTNLLSSEKYTFGGHFDDLQYTWYDSGSIETIDRLDINKKGPYKSAYIGMAEWYKNGNQKHEIKATKNPERYSKTSWYGNGQIKTQGIIVRDGEIGTHKAWYKDGQLKSELSYVIEKNRWGNRSVLNGEAKQWYSNGQLKEQAHYVKGQLVGKQTKWLDDGTLHSEKSWSL